MSDPQTASPHSSEEPPEIDPTLQRRANVALLKYGGARLLLFLALTVIIQVVAVVIDAPVPLVMSALLALIVAFPLSMLVFQGLRQEATESVATRTQQRQARKDWVKRELESR
ncbi:DUF4229 domain-containing protein [Corynebacterium alimapuense]|uniref:DUF4229 domain-containing protein n=1 Tax=Corynebacterium alimapuense TaxID=1576874 RepID=A0A3M8K8T4_9CORY|nr:DUF4229 domain-containing protein [Corynebacterium alimapuense]RNE48942.1 DUF4229 domain-containing protein [Corynebacterium alimapuense]